MSNSSYFPRLIQLGGQLNNDTLSVMLSVLALYYQLKWAKRRYENKWYFNYLDLAASGLFLGLAMMTKLNAGSIAIAMAAVFIYVLVNKDEVSKNKKQKDENNERISKIFTTKQL